MNTQTLQLKIRLYGIDGATRLFTVNDSDLVNRILMQLDPATLFAHETIRIADDDTETAFAVSELSRIDLMTDCLSVWDYPFVLGAPVELTQAEFCECLHNLPQWDSPRWQSDRPIFLEMNMVKDHRYWFWLEVVGGLSAVRQSRILTLLQKPGFIFGLRTGGIGILNLANLTHFSVYPESPELAGAVHGAQFGNAGKKSAASPSRHRRHVDEDQAHAPVLAQAPAK